MLLLIIIISFKGKRKFKDLVTDNDDNGIMNIKFYCFIYN